jgi:tRNA pseudouridine38-40 synthase
MRNIKLTLAYDGSEFHGWQVQPDRPTIQGTLTDLLRKLTQEEKGIVHGAGRTDAGVHALGQVAHFKTQSQLAAGEFQRAFNALLPPAIRVLQAEEVGPDFHARWQAQAKTYAYRIYLGPVVSPFQCRYVFPYPFALEREAMARAARLFEGEHDFASFSASSGSEDDAPAEASRRGSRKARSAAQARGQPSTIRLVYRSELILPAAGFMSFGTLGSPAMDGTLAAADSRDELLYIVRGRSFLRYMVRKIVGTLLELGRGKFAPEDIPRLFEVRDRSRSGPTVPACGLYLVSVEYPDPTASLDRKP